MKLLNFKIFSDELKITFSSEITDSPKTQLKY